MRVFGAAGLLVAFPVLCAVIGLEIASGPGAAPAGTPAHLTAPPAPAVVATEAPDQRAAWFASIVSRPLFSPDRRPIGPDVAAVRGLPRLTGIVITDQRRVAIFAGPPGGHPMVVESGSHVGVYDVREIGDAGVTLSGPEGTTLVRPIFDPNQAAAPKPGLPPPPRPPLPRPAGK